MKSRSIENLCPDVLNSDPEIMGGTVCFTGTRVPVQNLFDYLEGGSTIEEFMQGFPRVAREQIVAVLEESANSIIDTISTGSRIAA